MMFRCSRGFIFIIIVLCMKSRRGGERSPSKGKRNQGKKKKKSIPWSKVGRTGGTSVPRAG